MCRRVIQWPGAYEERGENGDDDGCGLWERVVITSQTMSVTQKSRVAVRTMHDLLSWESPIGSPKLALIIPKLVYPQLVGRRIWGYKTHYSVCLIKFQAHKSPCLHEIFRHKCALSESQIILLAIVFRVK